MKSLSDEITVTGQVEGFQALILLADYALNETSLDAKEETLVKLTKWANQALPVLRILAREVGLPAREVDFKSQN